MIKVYQIQLTDEEIALINRDGWGATARTKAYADRMFEDTFKEENFYLYDHVASVDCDTAEQAFRLMNLWEDESKVERVGPCSSMSVGDILDIDGELFRCASFGFDKLAIQNVEEI